MGKFNSYAKRLDEAFRESRDAYAALVEQLNAAKRADKMANTWFAETYVGEREVKKAQAKAKLMEAKNTFKAEATRIWNGYDGKANQIRTELLAAVREGGLADPDAVDANALELLKSGILTPEDMDSFASRFDTNPTMLKLISKYASDAAEKANAAGQHADRLKFVSVSMATKDGSGKVVRDWDKLTTAAMYCSGRARGRNDHLNNPDQAAVMGADWEKYTAEMIANF